MRVYRDPYIHLNTPTVIALGCFDGVHIAHSAVISEAVKAARGSALVPALWCFSEPPKNRFLSTPVPLICTEEEKIRRIKSLGVEIMITPDFTDDIASVTAEDFFHTLLCGHAGARVLVCGSNYTFGRGGQGDVRLLSKLCSEAGVALHVIDNILCGGRSVSSTLVRECVESGRLAEAEQMLGRAFSVCAEKRAVPASILPSVLPQAPNLQGKTAGEDNAISYAANKSTAGYLVPARYLSPGEGRYRVHAVWDGGSVECQVQVRRTAEGAMLLPDRELSDGAGRFTFSSDIICNP